MSTSSAAEYQSRFDHWSALRAEEERERLERLEHARYESELGDYDADEPEVAVAQEQAEPFVPSVRYVPFAADKIRECLDDGGATSSSGKRRRRRCWSSSSAHRLPKTTGCSAAASAAQAAGGS